MPAICRHGIAASESVIVRGTRLARVLTGRCRFCAESVDTFHVPSDRLRRERRVAAANAAVIATVRRGSIDAVYAAFAGRCDCGADVDGGPHIWPCE